MPVRSSSLPQRGREILGAKVGKPRPGAPGRAPARVAGRRLRAAAEADFVLALYNPRSARRNWQYQRAQEVLAAHRPPETPVGVVRNAYRPGQVVTITTVAEMDCIDVDMFTTVIIGNSQTRQFGSVIVTPRGYILTVP